MPAIRHGRPPSRQHDPVAYSSPAPPALSVPLPSSTPTSRGFSLDATPSFLRRSKRSYRTDDLVQRGLDASRLLQSVGESMQQENLAIVAATCALLFGTVNTVRTNKTQCIQLLERVHSIVRALINLSGDAGRFLSPAMGRSIAQFAGTLTQLHGLLHMQATYGLFQRILRHNEIQESLANCSDALEQALDVFSVQTALIADVAIGSLRKSSADRHSDLLRALGRDQPQSSTWIPRPTGDDHNHFPLSSYPSPAVLRLFYTTTSAILSPTHMQSPGFHIHQPPGNDVHVLFPSLFEIPRALLSDMLAVHRLSEHRTFLVESGREVNAPQSQRVAAPAGTIASIIIPPTRPGSLISMERRGLDGMRVVMRALLAERASLLHSFALPTPPSPLLLRREEMVQGVVASS
ncbi:hypothetical protein MKEN_00972600 [Mycena kentingensis (nom. inval.)]|nr:hypothetical protein MKEN_00972600 [Mycena kentingensis (nom. inval.)]